MWTVTLKDIRTNQACYEGYNKVVRMLQNRPFTSEDETRESYIRFKHTKPISLVDICKNNGLVDALWATQCLDEYYYRDLRLFGVWCLRRIQHLMTDSRSIWAIDVAEKFANGEVTYEELISARMGAWNAYYAAADIAAYAAIFVTSLSASSAADTGIFGDPTISYVDERQAHIDMFIQMCEGSTPW